VELYTIDAACVLERGDKGLWLHVDTRPVSALASYIVVCVYTLQIFILGSTYITQPTLLYYVYRCDVYLHSKSICNVFLILIQLFVICSHVMIFTPDDGNIKTLKLSSHRNLGSAISF
jgi:hypothetical protein